MRPKDALHESEPPIERRWIFEFGARAGGHLLQHPSGVRETSVSIVGPRATRALEGLNPSTREFCEVCLAKTDHPVFFRRRGIGSRRCHKDLPVILEHRDNAITPTHVYEFGNEVASFALRGKFIDISPVLRADLLRLVKTNYGRESLVAHLHTVATRKNQVKLRVLREASSSSRSTSCPAPRASPRRRAGVASPSPAA